MKEFPRFFLAVCTTLLFTSAAVTAQAETRQLLLPKLGASEAVSGQIDWPSGKLENWNGPVVLIVPSLTGTNRDGWSVLALASPNIEWHPFKDLADVLVRKGFAVARIDAPAIMPPAMKCRDTAKQRGLDETLLTTHCLKMDVFLRTTIDTYFDGIERTAAYLQKTAPGARHTLILTAIGQDIHIAAQVADRGNVKVHGLATIGGPATSYMDNLRWQTVDRTMETLRQFDTDGDGAVTEDEILAGHASGIGSFASLQTWRHPEGASWTSSNKEELRSQLNNDFQQLMAPHCPRKRSSCIYTQQIHGVSVPFMNDTVLGNLQHSRAALDVMAARRIPGLFLWGDKSEVLGAPEQARLVAEASHHGVSTTVVRYGSLHHFLSDRSDDEWMSGDMMEKVAGAMRDFVGQHFSGKPLRSTASVQAAPALK